MHIPMITKRQEKVGLVPQVFGTPILVPSAKIPIQKPLLEKNIPLMRGT